MATLHWQCRPTETILVLVPIFNLNFFFMSKTCKLGMFVNCNNDVTIQK